MPTSLRQVEALAMIRRLTADGGARRVRVEARLSQAELAEAIGVDQSTVARYEAGRRKPRGEAGLRYAAVIARLLEMAP